MKDPKVLLLYPPEQRWPGFMVKPNGSLAYPMLSGALKEIDCHVEVYDACIGNDEDDIGEFYKSTELPSGLLRTGVSDERILEVVKDFDVVGITSIFSSQETMVLHCVKIIKKEYPDKLLLSGGNHARWNCEKFLNHGFDIVATSEAEETIKEIIQEYRKGTKDWSHIRQIMYSQNGKTIDNSLGGKVIMNLDKLPFPDWKILPLERYWKIKRGHGVEWEDEEVVKWASIQTSLGCPFSCSYCHLSKEFEGSLSGNIGRHRIKSEDRVMEELTHLKNNLGIKQIFIEDDAIFGRKKRAIKILERMIDLDLRVMNINGINIIHLVKKGDGEFKWEPDFKLIELMAKAGFTDFSFPFESGNGRIIKKWASNKWDVENTNIKGLIKAFTDNNIKMHANYMIGFPDETKEEIENTIEFAKQNVEWGITTSGFFIVMPLPGTSMFDYCMEKGHLPVDYDIDRMSWRKANMINIGVKPEELEAIRDKAWEEVNSDSWKKNRRELIVADPKALPLPKELNMVES
tara:strand:- start:2754 stop:4304 length:1551 start_codon:yes stop_codon:yes gene_type:complete